MEEPKPALSTRVLRQIIGGIDAHLRRSLGVVEFEQGSDAVVRISVDLAKREIVLSDGVRLRPDDRVIELHLWNEHLLTLPQAGATLQWAAATRRLVLHSLGRLAEHVQATPDLRDVKALRIRPAFAGRKLGRNLGWIVAQHGFESVERAGPEIRSSRAHRWLDSLWVWLLTWTYNPRSLRGRRFSRTRLDYWISRERFIALYAAPGARAHAAPRRSIAGRPRAG